MKFQTGINILFLQSEGILTENFKSCQVACYLRTLRIHYLWLLPVKNLIYIYGLNANNQVFSLLKCKQLIPFTVSFLKLLDEQFLSLETERQNYKEKQFYFKTKTWYFEKTPKQILKIIPTNTSSSQVTQICPNL